MKDMKEMKDGIHAIIQKINIDAQQHSSEHYEQGKNKTDWEIEGENTAYIDELARNREMLKKNNELEYGRLFERLSSRLHREILTYQHNLIDEIFDMAAAKLRDASEKECKAMFRAAVKGLKGSFVLYLGELSKNKLDRTEIDKTVKENDGIEIVMSDETIPRKSGFVLRDERVEYNCLFEDLIEDMKNEQAAAILKEVFENAETRLNI